MIFLCSLIIIGIKAKRQGAVYVPWALLMAATLCDSLICGGLALALVPTP